MGEALCTVVNDIINNKRTKNKTREVEAAIASTSLTGPENHLASFRFQNTFLLNV